jgi:hypothetical protein
MDKAALVSMELVRGSELVDALDRAKMKVNVALWVVLPEYEDWRMVISSRQLDSLDLLEAYGVLFDALAPSGFTPETTPPIMILKMGDPFIKDLRRVFGKTKSVEGMRFGKQTIGDRFIEDGFAYRIS